jgi:hypothetical protein
MQILALTTARCAPLDGSRGALRDDFAARYSQYKALPTFQQLGCRLHFLVRSIQVSGALVPVFQ